jgi:hypothetical protein
MHVPHPDAVWRKVFTGPYALPENGPKGEEAMNYTVSYGNSLFIGIDEFISEKSLINQKWLDTVLKAHKEDHVFVFAHKMAFRSGHHDDGLETEPAVRDAFVKSLIAAGSIVGFFGHDHLYDHRAVTAPEGGEAQTFHQFVIGTAGAPLAHGTDEPGDNGQWKVKKFSHIEDRYGYAVVEVDGPKVTITFKARKSAGVYEVADTFSYTIPKAANR